MKHYLMPRVMLEASVAVERPYNRELILSGMSGVVDYVNFNAYKVKLNTATAFAQKFKYNMTTDAWVELN